MPEAFITPHVLKAARERAGVDRQQLAEKMGIAGGSDKVKAWEHGDLRPTFVQARKAAHVLHYPFAALFMAEPLDLDPTIPDLRTLGAHPLKPSLDLMEVYQDALFKLDWVRSERVDEEQSPVGFVGAGKSNAEVAAAVAAVRELLAFQASDRARCPDAEAYLRELVRRAESGGVLVLRSATVGANTHRRLSVEEFRGFSISDPFAPMVFINTADAKAAQVFTFIHELAHIWRAETGISRPDVERAHTRHSATEAFCDKVAAEFLVPEQELKTSWASGEDITDNAHRLRRHFKVSGLVVARRARDLNLVTQTAYAAFVKEEMKLLSGASPGTGGPGFLTMVRLRNGSAITEMVVNAVRGGRLLYRQGGSLLGVQPPVIDQLMAPGGAG